MDKPTAIGALGGGVLLIACCLLAPLVIGTAGAVVLGVEAFLAVAVGLLLVLAFTRRRRCNCEGSCDRNQCQGKESGNVG